LPPCGIFGLSLAGRHDEPDEAAMALAKELPPRFSSLLPSIETGLFEHYAPYREAFVAGEYPGDSCPQIKNAEGVWPYVTPEHVLIESFSAGLTVEIAFHVAWDEEHTVAARFRDWQFIELNGSVRSQ
jgi:hypothetical protein